MDCLRGYTIKEVALIVLGGTAAGFAAGILVAYAPYFLDRQGFARRKLRRVRGRSAWRKLKTAKIEQGSESELCEVCLEKFEKGSKVKALTCSHKHHEECILQWFQRENSCPLCRRRIV